MTKFLYQLFFTRDDDLDILQVLFSVIVIVTLVVTYKAMIAQSTDIVKVESLITLRWLAGLLVLTAIPKWLVPAMKNIVTKKLEFGKTTVELTTDDTTNS